ncbi:MULTISPECIES: ATP-binding protein [unclassified Streptomyces]|uniref:ATP-binding protein n=1 Tax=unclassified Streptomyces TaxID=2593676 RepID=UPI002258745D|nr:ATP-binding protein [Streptomyces sp. NBC_00199]MCX5265229.1 ATP-binding protein [Streptomyces sp. NBC_00199]
MQLEIRPDPAEVGRARRWARSRLVGSGIGNEEPLAETLILLVSELVTNAVVHTGCPAVLRLSLPGGAAEPSIVRLEVADSSDRAPVPRCAGDEATGGRGLALVDGLADRWGWSVEGAGKRIWCELDRCAAPAEVAVDRGGAAECVGVADRAGVVRKEPRPAYGGRAYEAV